MIDGKARQKFESLQSSEATQRAEATQIATATQKDDGAGTRTADDDAVPPAARASPAPRPSPPAPYIQRAHERPPRLHPHKPPLVTPYSN